MRIIRNNVFETNSSSTHALVIPKENTKYGLETSWNTDYEFDRESGFYNQWDKKTAYAYMAVKYHYEDNDDYINIIANFKKNINEMYKKLKKELKLKEVRLEPDNIFDIIDKEDGFSYIDHGYRIPEEFVNKLVEDEEFLKRFVFDREAYISTGGDEYRGFYIKTIGFEYDFEGDWDETECSSYGEFWKRLRDYEETHEVYFKGN